MYTLKNIMNFFSIPERTIRRHLKLGLLKGSKIGGVWKFTNFDIERYTNNKSISDLMTKTSIDRLNDYTRGFIKHKNDICITFNSKQLPDSSVHKITNFINQFQHPFYFHISNNIKNRTLIFIGHIEDSLSLINLLKEYVNE